MAEEKKKLKPNDIGFIILAIFAAIALLAGIFAFYATLTEEHEKAVTQQAEIIQLYRDYSSTITMEMQPVDKDGNYFNINGEAGRFRSGMYGIGSGYEKGVVRFMALDPDSGQYEIFERYFSNVEFEPVSKNENPYAEIINKKTDNGYEYEEKCVLHIPADQLQN